MSKYDNIKKDIIEILQNDKSPDICDLSDIGNLIGIAIGKYVDENEMGYEKDAVIDGIKHGISLIDGTH